MLSIIIVNFHSWSFIERNLDNLVTSFPSDIDKNNWPFEVIVADNSTSYEGLEEFSSKFPQVIIHKANGNLGYSHGCNQGANLASGDWLLFMNPDIICDWHNLKLFTEEAKNQTQFQILSAPQYDLAGKRLQRSFAPFPDLVTYFSSIRILLRLLVPKKYPNPRIAPSTLDNILEVDWVTGSLLLISSKNFGLVNGWDEDYWLYSEDIDICKRARNMGMKVGYYPHATFTHTHACSTRSSLKTKVLTKSETIISSFIYLQKHHENNTGEVLKFFLKFRTTIRYPLLKFFSLATFGKVNIVEQKKLIHQRLWNFYSKN